jgi:hypothetical protein
MHRRPVFEWMARIGYAARDIITAPSLRQAASKTGFAH